MFRKKKLSDFEGMLFKYPHPQIISLWMKNTFIPLDVLYLDEYYIIKEFNVPFRQLDENNETYTVAPMINCSSDGSIESFRFSNQLMQMIDPTKEGIKDFYDAYHEISSMVHDSKYSSTFRLNSGEVLIVSSLRVLHAREPFVPNGKRHLQDAYFVYDNALNHSII